VLGLEAPRQAAAIRSRVGYMPENDAFIANLTAVSFLCLMGEIAGLPREAALERAHEALFYVGLGEARYRLLGTYSQGMRQMAKLAQALVHGPGFLILDEPTNSLDPPARTRMLRLIREIRDGGECRILLCSHLLHDVEETCDEVVILNRGRIVHQAHLDDRGGSTRWLELEAAGEAAAAFLENLRGLGCVVEARRGGRWGVTLAEGVGVRDLYRLADQHNVLLPRLGFHRDTLEDVFLRAMSAASDANGEVS
jgi:ABC-2 type transport system ATP-binding protein